MRITSWVPEPNDDNADWAKSIAEGVRDGLDRLEQVLEEDNREGIEQVLDEVGGDINRLKHLINEADKNMTIAVVAAIPLLVSA